MPSENKPLISIIAAIGKNRELGKNSELIWRVSDDLKRVKALTTNHPIIMGRKTFESIGKPLPNRTNIVVTRSQICIDGCLMYDTLDKALEAAKAIENEEIFIFGGAQIYEQAINKTDRLYLTLIDSEDTEADTYFPEYEKDFTNVFESEKRQTEEGLSYEWLTLER